MLQKIKNFLKKDVRWKLIIISELTKLRFFYPKKFKIIGFSGLYTKLIIRLIINEKISKIRKNLIKKNFHTNNINKKINFLISTPASGSMFIRNIMSSYLELLFKVGDGYPKYDNINNDYIFACSPIMSGDLFNSLDIKKQGFIDDLKYTSYEDFMQKRIIFSRYPLTRVDLYDLNDIKPLILFRNPIDQIISRYTRSDNRADDQKFSIVDKKLLYRRIKEYEVYIKYWSNYIKNKKNGTDFMLIYFENLVSESDKVIKNILKFFEYEINEDYVKKAVHIHSKDNTQDFFNTIKNYNITRFTNPEVKMRQKDLIKPYVDQELLKRDITNSFKILYEEAQKNYEINR